MNNFPKMTLFQSSNPFNTQIPDSAIEIKVTNIVNPFFIQIYEVENYQTEIEKITSKIRKHLKIKKEDKNHVYQPNVGDHVVAFYSEDCLYFPNSAVRGIVIKIEGFDCRIILLDYGTVCYAPIQNLIKYKLPDPPLTMTVSLNNVLPVTTLNLKVPISASNVNLELSENNQWPETTIDFVQEIIEASEKIYFDVAAHDRDSKLYGEMYLLIGGTKLSLSTILIHKMMAVSYNQEFRDYIKNCSGKTNALMIPYKFGDTESIKQKQNNLRSLKKRNLFNERMMIRSHFECKPLIDLTDARFNRAIHATMKQEGINKMKIIQSYMWPAVKNGLNVVIINPKNSGKSIGYIIPIVNEIIENKKQLVEERKKLQNINKPIALIMCSSTDKVLKVADGCKKFSYCDKNIKTLDIFTGKSDKDIAVGAYNKSQIVVSTPLCLLRFLEKYPNYLDFSGLSYYVMDHVNILLEKHKEPLDLLHQKYKILNKDRRYKVDENMIQIVAVGTTWTRDLELFIKMNIDKPYTCIGSFLEAAAYNNIVAKMSLRKSSQKKNCILDSITDYKQEKTMIVCVNDEEAIELNTFLKTNGVKTLLVHGNMLFYQINEIKKDWHQCLKRNYPIIICTDDILLDLDILDVEFLIHYTITETSKTQFYNRFSVLMDNYVSDKNTRGKTYIIADDSCNVQFDGLLKILERLRIKIPEEWYTISKGISIKLNKERINYEICESVKSFGFCLNSCIYRHCVLKEVDFPRLDGISIGDSVELIKPIIHTASHFSARLLSFTKADTRVKITVQSKILEIGTELQNYYSRSNSKRLRLYKNIEIGNYCVYLRPDSTFHRVKITNIVEKDYSNTPTFVSIKFIDSGEVSKKVSITVLYESPDQFSVKNYPPNIFDVYVVGIQPFDNEYKWSDVANAEALEWFKKYHKHTTNAFASGKVALHIGTDLYIDSVVVCNKILNHSTLASETVSKHLIDKGHAIENPQHIPKLLELCQNGGIVIDEPFIK